MRRDELRERLLQAAEDVLRDGGRLSVREVTGAAGVNVAAVTTAFGGRSALLDELIARKLADVNAERERRYAALDPDADTEEVVRAFVEPLVALEPDDGSTVSAALRLLVDDRDADAGDGPVDRLLRDPGVARFETELTRTLSALPALERSRRLRLTVGAILSAAAWSGRPGLAAGSDLDGLVGYLSRGLRP